MMKRFIAIIAVIGLVCLSGAGHAEEGAFQFKTLTSSGIIANGSAIMKGYLMGTDGTNDVSAFTIYDGTDNTGRKIVPTHGIVAANQGLNGATGLNFDCPSGIYAEFTTSGTAELIVYYRYN